MRVDRKAVISTHFLMGEEEFQELYAVFRVYEGKDGKLSLRGSWVWSREVSTGHNICFFGQNSIKSSLLRGR